MKHVWEIMKDKANDQKQIVKIDRPIGEDPCDPKVEQIYLGRLCDTPPKVALQRVQSVGWSDYNSCPLILLEPYDMPSERDQFLSEIYEACENDPFIRDQIVRYLIASEYGRQMMESRALNDLLID